VEFVSAYRLYSARSVDLIVTDATTVDDIAFSAKMPDSSFQPRIYNNDYLQRALAVPPITPDVIATKLAFQLEITCQIAPRPPPDQCSPATPTLSPILRSHRRVFRARA
jgi:hypothetical protein